MNNSKDVDSNQMIELRVLEDTGHQYFSIPDFAGDNEPSPYWQAVKDHPWIRWRYQKIERGGSSSDVSSDIGVKGRYLIAVETNVGGEDRGTKVEHFTPADPGVPIAAKDQLAAFTYARAANVSKGTPTTFPLPDARQVRIVWEENRDEWLPVDLIVDMGNSRTSALLIEPPKDNEVGDPLVRMSSPLIFPPPGWSIADFAENIGKNAMDYAIPNSWLVLSEGAFAEWPLNAVESRAQAFGVGSQDRARILLHGFVEVSPAVIGGGDHKGGARDLVISQITAIRDKRVMQSSPKRYAWDTERASEMASEIVSPLWFMLDSLAVNHAKTQMGGVKKLGGLIRHLMCPEDDKLNFSDTGVSSMGQLTDPTYPRADSICWFALGVVEAASRQINSAVHRKRHGNSNNRRFLRSVRISTPGVWSHQERDLFRHQWEKALDLFTKSRWTKSQNTDQWGIAPEKAFKEVDGSKSGRRPRLIVDRLDETVAGQLPIVFAELRALGNSFDDWFDLYGKGKDPARVKVFHLDIGGGTSDYAIVEYVHPIRLLTTLKGKPVRDMDPTERAFLQRFCHASHGDKRLAEEISAALKLDVKISDSLFLQIQKLSVTQSMGTSRELPFFVSFRGGSLRAGDRLLKLIIEELVLPKWFQKSYEYELGLTGKTDHPVAERFAAWLCEKDGKPISRLANFFREWETFNDARISPYCGQELQVVVRLVLEPIACKLLELMQLGHDPRNVDTSVASAEAKRILNRLAFRVLHSDSISRNYVEGSLNARKQDGKNNDLLEIYFQSYAQRERPEDYESWYEMAENFLHEFLPFSPNVQLKINEEDVRQCLERVFAPLFKGLAGRLCESDLVVLSGKVTELPQVREMILEVSGLNPLRVVEAKGFPVGSDWYPFHNAGRVEDAKTVSVCGSALYHASQRGWLSKQGFGFHDLGTAITRHFWGVIKPVKQIALTEDSAFFKIPKPAASQGRSDNALGLFAPDSANEVQCSVTDGMLIGKVLSRQGDPEPTPVYRVSVKPGIDSKTVTSVTIRRKDGEDGSDYLEIAESDAFELGICPMPSGSFWMDRPLLNVRLPKTWEALEKASAALKEMTPAKT